MISPLLFIFMSLVVIESLIFLGIIVTVFIRLKGAVKNMNQIKNKLNVLKNNEIEEKFGKPCSCSTEASL